MFDPVEYVDWEPDPAVMDQYHRTLAADSERQKIIKDLSEDARLDLYSGMLRFRLHDITLKRWVKQGILSKAWLGTGEEAVTVGNVHALDRSCDLVAPMIRNAGACHEMGMPVADMFREYLATADSPSKGKDLHVGGLKYGVIAPPSQVGSLAAVIPGVGLSFKNRNERRVVLSWIGDGATKTAACHEGLNMAAVLRVPVLFVFQNNQVALGTRFDRHQVGPFSSWSKAYGVAGFECDGNNVLDTYAATSLAADHARNGGGPAIIFAETFRMGGHATHDEREGRDMLGTASFEQWGKKDPIGTFETYLENTGTRRSVLDSAEERVIQELAQAEKEALESRDNCMPAPESALTGVYGDS
jgi:TPP-dependent pyruvate/acetoin dehydrogenase alpha subunit